MTSPSSPVSSFSSQHHPATPPAQPTDPIALIGNREERSLLHVVNADQLVHYGTRPTTWVKLSTRLLRDDAYCALTAGRRAILAGIWMHAASNGWSVPDDALFLSRVLAMRVRRTDLDALVAAGFLERRSA